MSAFGCKADIPFALDMLRSTTQSGNMPTVSKMRRNIVGNNFMNTFSGSRWGSGRRTNIDGTPPRTEHDSGSVVKPHWTQGVGDADTALQRTSAKSKCS